MKRRANEKMALGWPPSSASEEADYGFSGSAGLPVDVPEPPGHQELHDAAQEHVEREGEPEGVVADHGLQGIENSEVGGR